MRHAVADWRKRESVASTGIARGDSEWGAGAILDPGGVTVLRKDRGAKEAAKGVSLNLRHSNGRTWPQYQPADIATEWRQSSPVWAF